MARPVGSHDVSPTPLITTHGDHVSGACAQESQGQPAQPSSAALTLKREPGEPPLTVPGCSGKALGFQKSPHVTSEPPVHTPYSLLQQPKETYLSA